MSDRHTERAKQLLREQLQHHPDPGVRLLAGMADLPDDDPAVVRVAAALREAQP